MVFVAFPHSPDSISVSRQCVKLFDSLCYHQFSWKYCALRMWLCYTTFSFKKKRAYAIL